MAFLKRLGFFLVGLSIGIVFLTMFLKKKSDETGVSFCYFPNCRTLKDIRSKPLYYSDEIKKMIQEQQLDSIDISNFLTNGEVNFGNSDSKSKLCKTYLVEGSIKGKEAVLTIRNCIEKALVEKITTVK